MKHLGLGIAIAAMWIAAAVSSVVLQNVGESSLIGFVLAFFGTLIVVVSWPNS